MSGFVGVSRIGVVGLNSVVGKVGAGHLGDVCEAGVVGAFVTADVESQYFMEHKLYMK